jgi:hypothetical protein
MSEILKGVPPGVKRGSVDLQRGRQAMLRDVDEPLPEVVGRGGPHLGVLTADLP